MSFDPCRTPHIELATRPPTRSRFWLLPPPQFAAVAIEFDPAHALFSLLCYRRRGRGPALANAVPNGYRLRELEATLIDLHIALPETLRRYFVAVLGEDERERALREPEVQPYRCRPRIAAESVAEGAHVPQAIAG